MKMDEGGMKRDEVVVEWYLDSTPIHRPIKLRFEAGQWEWRFVTYNRRNDKKP
jgi:hypothetical protein